MRWYWPPHSSDLLYIHFPSKRKYSSLQTHFWWHINVWTAGHLSPFIFSHCGSHNGAQSLHSSFSSHLSKNKTDFQIIYQTENSKQKLIVLTFLWFNQRTSNNDKCKNDYRKFGHFSCNHKITNSKMSRLLMIM